MADDVLTAWIKCGRDFTCDCIYVDEAHPNCDRLNPTVLVDLGSGSTAAMCRWCAEDWQRRHPSMTILVIGSGEETP
jgi:hypothetical protein